MRRERRPEEREEEEQRDATPAPPQHQLLQLQRTLGNRAVTQILARNASGAPPIKDRAPIDDLAKKQNVAPVDRIRSYAQIAGTQAVGLDPAVVHSGPVKEGGNLGTLKQADEVGAAGPEGHAPERKLGYEAVLAATYLKQRSRREPVFAGEGIQQLPGIQANGYGLTA